jgi:hypothetical protein
MLHSLRPHVKGEETVVPGVGFGDVERRRPVMRARGREETKTDRVTPSASLRIG